MEFVKLVMFLELEIFFGVGRGVGSRGYRVVFYKVLYREV